MATKYELPEKVTENRLRTLGKEVEMKAFETNVTSEEETSDGDWLVKIICVGDYTGGEETKGKFIRDYLQYRPPVKPIVDAFEPYSKAIKWQTSESEHPLLIKFNIL